MPELLMHAKVAEEKKKRRRKEEEKRKENGKKNSLSLNSHSSKYKTHVILLPPFPHRPNPSNRIDHHFLATFPPAAPADGAFADAFADGFEDCRCCCCCLGLEGAEEVDGGSFLACCFGALPAMEEVAVDDDPCLGPFGGMTPLACVPLSLIGGLGLDLDLVAAAAAAALCLPVAASSSSSSPNCDSVCVDASERFIIFFFSDAAAAAAAVAFLASAASLFLFSTASFLLFSAAAASATAAASSSAASFRKVAFD